MIRELVTHGTDPSMAIADAGEQAAYRFFEFFTSNIRDLNTRRDHHRTAHELTKTPKLNDRTNNTLTLDEVERIAF